MSFALPAGTTRFVPAVLLVLIALAFAGWPGANGPAPVEASDQERFTEPGADDKPEPGPLEKAVSRVAGRSRSKVGLPDSEDAVRFLLHLYAEQGAETDRDRALAMARRLSDGSGGIGSPQALYALAQAGAGTLGEAEALMTRRAEFMGMAADRATTDSYAGYVRDLFARAGALREPGMLLNALLATGDFLESRTRLQGRRLMVLPGGNAAEKASLSDHVETLRTVVTAAQASGSADLRGDAARLGHEIIQQFWNEETARFHDATAPDPLLSLLMNMRAATALWEAGWLNDDRLLIGRGRRVLDAGLSDALKEPLVSPAAALAAARHGGHPVQMVLVGGPGDPTLIDLRQECFFAFEPRGMLLTLDPQEDAARLEEMGYPTEFSPALFVCVGFICSAPLEKPHEVEKTLRDILALSREAAH